MLLQEQMKINRSVEGCDGNPFFVKRVNFESALIVIGHALNFLCKLKQESKNKENRNTSYSSQTVNKKK